MTDLDYGNVSAHFFDLLVSSEGATKAYALEDIQDETGEVLVSSGQTITSELKVPLVSKKLQKPLEMLITADYIISSKDVSQEACSILEEFPVFKRIFIAAEKEAALLSEVNIAPLPALLLSISKKQDKKAFRHSVLVALVARVVGRKLRFEEHEMLMLTQAAIAHDVGELYVDHGEAITETRYTPEDWKQTMAHPKIGALLIKHCTNYAPEVARAICEHHEREDGSGYPRKLVGSQISELGKVLMVSELLAGMLLKPDFPIRRALLVLKFMPEEFPKEVLNAIHRMVAETAIYELEVEQNFVQWGSAKVVIDELTQLEKTLVEFLATSGSIIELEIAKEAMGKIIKIKHAIRNLGLQFCLNPEQWKSLKDDPVIQLELDVAAREIAWRLRDTSRDMVLNLSESNAKGTPKLKVIIERMSQVSLS
jgi:HD-GYP domain-containing protein (c-di-GMP phosphodiesterase class II)